MSKAAIPGSKDNKIANVITWLENEQNATIVRVRGSVVIIQTDIHTELCEEGQPVCNTVRVSTFVATDKEVERWFDAAARKMMMDGCCHEDALADTWPVHEDGEPGTDDVESRGVNTALTDGTDANQQ